MQVLKSSLYLVITALFVFLSACGNKKFDTEAEFLKWLNDDENGLVLHKEVGGLQLKVKYLPASYLAYKEFVITDKNGNLDSLKNYYSHSLSFLLTIEPHQNIKGSKDLIKDNVTNMDQYKDKLMSMNFNMSEYLELIVDDKKYTPVLAKVEDTYGLQKHRNIYVVYELSSAQSEKTRSVDFVFNDMIFNTGINHFVFTGKSMSGVAEIKL